MRLTRRIGAFVSLVAFAVGGPAITAARADQPGPTLTIGDVAGTVHTDLTHGDVVVPPAAAVPGALRVAQATANTTFAGFNAVQPARVLDTRIGIGVPAPGPVPSQGHIDVQMAGRGGVPGDAVSVVLNVTVTEPTQGGFITVWPTGTAQPNASSLNMVAGETIPNLVIAKIGAGGMVSFYNDSGSSHLLADVVAWSRGDGHYVGLAPARILDTRSGTGAAGPEHPGQTIELNVRGVGGVPSGAAAGAVVLNVTATEPTATSFITVWPSGTARPNASSLNMVAGETVPNLVIAAVGANGKVDFFNNNGDTQLIADVVGWMPAGAAYYGFTPLRVMDTRSNIGNYAPKQTLPAPLGPGAHMDLDLTPLLPYSVADYVLNVTVTDPTATSYITVWPTGSPQPNASNLNTVAGQTAPNLVFAKPGPDGRISIYNNAGTANVIVDLVGFVPLQNGLDTPADIAEPDYHVVYLLGSDSDASPGAVAAATATIRGELGFVDQWLFDQSSLAPAIPRRLNLDTAGSQVEVTPWQLPTWNRSQLQHWPDTNASIVGLLNQMIDDGLGSPFRRYLIYVDADRSTVDGLCGLRVGQFTTLFVNSQCGQVGAVSSANAVGGVAPNHSNSAQVALHEMMHGLGAVPSCSNDYDRTDDPAYSQFATVGHAHTQNDLMYWNAGVGQPKTLDPGHDSYFGQAVPGCRDVSQSVFLHAAAS